MPGMSRADREPADDVKRRIVAACQDAGLTVWSARMQLRREHRHRHVQVDMVMPTGPFQRCVIGVTTTIGMDGGWSGCVKIGCAAVEDDENANDWKVPIMRGRESVPLHELTQELTNTVKEREQVAGARKAGIDGPYIFDQTCWEASWTETGSA